MGNLPPGRGLTCDFDCVLMVVAKKGAMFAPSREWRFKMRTREPLGIGVLLLGALLCGCGSSGSGGTPPPPPSQAATPTFSPAPGNYSSTQNVTLADSTAGASIYYTTNGTTPTTGSTLYSSPIAVSSTTTIEAIATASGYTNSALATGTYTITAPAAEPTITTTRR